MQKTSEKKTNLKNYSTQLATITFLSFSYFLALLIKTWGFKYLLLSVRFYIFVSFLLFGALIFAWEYFHHKNAKPKKSIISSLAKLPGRIRGSVAAGILLIPTIVFLFVRFPMDDFGINARWAVVIGCLSLAVLFWIPNKTPQEQTKWVLIFGVMMAALYSVGLAFNQVTDYPLSLTWSGGNRMWDWSILFGSDRYITTDSKPLIALIDPGRAFLWGLPFLIPNLSILGARFWNATVLTAPYIILGLLLVWPERKKIGWLGIILFGAWSFLFIRQGPIYSPLILSAILVVIAVRIRKLPIAAFFVMIAGYYAGITRFHWIFGPGLWAGMIALQNIPFPTLKKTDWGKLIRPIVLGISGFVGGQILPKLFACIKIKSTSCNFFIIENLSINDSLKQPLLWGRWLPNPTYGPGILLGLLVAVGPALLFYLSIIFLKKQKINWLQQISNLLILIAFLGVGLVASVKIGGGGDLHNLDLFIVTILILIAHVWVKIWDYLNQSKISFWGYSSLAIFLILPGLLIFNKGNPLVLAPRANITQLLSEIQSEVDLAQEDGGEVLFIDQRQLITFDFIQNLVMVDEYEKKLLIDTAFSEDMDYFQEFYDDLENHRFNLILTEKLFTGLKFTGGFSEENNYWAIWVAQPLLDNYETLTDYEDFGIQLLVPIQ